MPPTSLPNGVVPGGLQPAQQPNGGPSHGPYPGPPHVNGFGQPMNGPAIGTPGGPPVPVRPGMPQQQRPGNGPFQQSPTMAPSPRAQGPVQQGGQQPGPTGHGQNRPMPPPGGQGMPNSSNLGGPQPTSQPAFQQPLVGSGGSHPNSPAQNPMTARSPSLANRQAPNPQQELINQEVFRVESSKIPELKAELGIPSHTDLLSMTHDEKVCKPIC